MTGRAIVAISGSVLIHGLIAAAIVFYLKHAPGPTVSVTLDLSSVELSFSEQETEAPAAPRMPQDAAPSRERRPPTPEEAPPDPGRVRQQAPEPGAVRLREPEERIAEMKTPERPEPEKIEKPQPETVAPAVPAPKQARVDAPPRPRRTIRPEYPRGARQRGEEGNVVLEIEVGTDGACSSVRVAESSGFAELDGAAVKAAKAARFVPAKSGDRPVASTARLTLTFRLK